MRSQRTLRNTVFALILAAAALVAACQHLPKIQRELSPPTHGGQAHRGHADKGHARGGHASRSLLAVHDPRRVTGTLSGPCHARHSGELPDRHCTPGSYDPAVTQANIHATICRAGYTETVRPPESQTERFKFDEAEPAYGQHHLSGELDHLVSLELGGSNDAANLWVEAGSIPNPKDHVENVLHDAVCAGRVRLRAAQRAIAGNWIRALDRLGLP